jgi:DNA-binding protein HU-beta
VTALIKQDIVHHVIARTGLPRTKAEAAVDTVFEGLKEALAAGERIELRGFGVFSVRARKTGIGRNPRTGTEVSITPGKAVRSKRLIWLGQNDGAWPRPISRGQVVPPMLSQWRIEACIPSGALHQFASLIATIF